MYAVDWSIKKEFKIYNIKNEKLKSILPTREAFDKFFSKLLGESCFYIEEGGGNIFKLLALKNGHKVFTIVGKCVKQYREGLGWPKTDKNDVKIIAILVEKHLEKFHQYRELSTISLAISVLYKEYSKVIGDSTRKKNQLWALEQRLGLSLSNKVVKKIISKRKDTIEVLGKEVSILGTQLLKLVQKHPLWTSYLKNIKGVGPVTAAGIIGSVGRFSRFENRNSVRYFAGMMMKNKNSNYNRQLKFALYNFVEGIIKNRTQPWRDLYDEAKGEYRYRHPNWRKAKIDAYAKKYVQTKFLLELWRRGKQLEVGVG